MSSERSHPVGIRPVAVGPLERIRVLVGVRHDRLRRGIAGLLAAEADLSVVESASEWTKLVSAAKRLRPDVIVANLRAEEASLVATIERLAEQLPEIGIVVLTMDPSAAVAHRLIVAGACGLVLTERADSELPEAVRAAASRREFISAPVRQRLEQLRS